ncbi:diiron oxygenase [Streptomyces sp. M10(2022)]
MDEIPNASQSGAFTVAQRLRSLPEHDPDNAVENAILSRLAGNWNRRATVKRPEESLDDVFERDRPDFPVALLPFRDHPTYLALDDETRARILAWGWVAFNKNIMDIEQHVVNPGSPWSPRMPSTRGWTASR